MKTAKAIEHAAQEAQAKGEQNTGQKALAELLGITPSAISQWGEDMPEPRMWQLRWLRPQWFEEPKVRGKAKVA